MATITSTPTAGSLSVSGSTQVSGTISWSTPTVPSGATITSCILTGTATSTMSKGSATITVNGSSVTSGRTFTVNLGTTNTTTSVATTAKGGNKNAAGTVSFSNLVYTVTYELPKTKYTVTFLDWDGTVLVIQEVEEGSGAIINSTPTREGYTFIGWDKDYNYITSDLTVTAQYEKNSSGGEEVPIESIKIDVTNDIVLNVGMSKQIKAIITPENATEKYVWNLLNNTKVSISVNDSPPDTLVLYGQETLPSLKNCTINQTYNSFTIASFSDANAAVTYEVNGLNAGEIYTLTMDYSEGIVIEIYHGETYTAGNTDTEFELTGYTAYTIVFYNNNGTTSNWGVNNISFVDSNGNNNFPVYDGRTATITGIEPCETVLECISPSNDLINDACNISVINIEDKDLGCDRGIFSWVYEDLLSPEALARACNVLNLTEVYQQITNIYEFTQEQIDELSDSICELKRLTKHNVNVVYLDGDAQWYSDPTPVIDRINGLIQFNNNNKNNITINKIMLDLEPWSAGITGWYPVYQETMLDVYTHCQNNNIELALCVPFWLDNGIDPTIVTDFHKIVIDLCDDYVCMNYNKNGYLTNMDVEMEYIKATGKKIYSCAECQPVSEEWGVTENLTYYYDGLDVLYSHWRNIYNRYGYDKLGFAIHDFNNAIKIWTSEVDITEATIQSVSFDKDSDTITSEDGEPIVYKLNYNWEPINADKDFTISIDNPSIASYNEITDELTFTGNGDVTVTITSNENQSITDTIQLTLTGQSDTPEVEVIEWSGLGTVATDLKAHAGDDDYLHDSYKINLDWENESFDIIITGELNRRSLYLYHLSQIGDIKIGNTKLAIIFSDGAISIYCDDTNNALEYYNSDYIGFPFTVSFTKNGIYVKSSTPTGEYSTPEFLPGSENTYEINQPIYLIDDSITNLSISNQENPKYNVIFDLVVSEIPNNETTYINKLHIGELIIDKLYIGNQQVNKMYIGETLLYSISSGEEEPDNPSSGGGNATGGTIYPTSLSTNDESVVHPALPDEYSLALANVSSIDEQYVYMEVSGADYYENAFYFIFDLSSYSNIQSAKLRITYNAIPYYDPAEETSVLVDNNTIGTLSTTSSTFKTDEFDVTNYIKGKTSTSIGINCTFGEFSPFISYFSYGIDCVSLTIN